MSAIIKGSLQKSEASVKVQDMIMYTHTYTYIHTDRQTDRQTDRKTDRQTQISFTIPTHTHTPMHVRSSV